MLVGSSKLPNARSICTLQNIGYFRKLKGASEIWVFFLKVAYQKNHNFPQKKILVDKFYDFEFSPVLVKQILAIAVLRLEMKPFLKF